MSRQELGVWWRRWRQVVALWTSIGTLAVLILTVTQGYRSWESAGLPVVATRGWVVERIAEESARARDRWADASEKTQAQLDELSRIIRHGQEVALRTQLDVVDAALAQRRAERVDLQAQLERDAGAVTIRRRLAEVDAEIERLERRWAQTACDLAVLRGDRPAC